MVKPPEHSQQPSARDADERQRLCDLLQRQVRFLQDVINAMPDPVFLKDRQSRFRDCNQAFADLFGRSRADILGKTTFDLFPDVFARQNQSVDEDLFDRPAAERRYQTTIVRPDGSARQVVIHKALLKRDGPPEGVVGIITDITERKRVEKALRDSRNLLHRVFEGIPDLLSVVDKDLRIQISNWHGGFEYVPETMRSGHPFCYEVYYPEQDGPCRPCHLKEVFRTGRPITREKYNPRIGHLEIRAFPVFDENERVVLAAEYIRDISDRKAAEAALRDSEGQLRRITDNMLDIVSEADREGLFRYLSPSHRAVLGFEPDSLIGTSLYDLMHPEDLARMREVFQVILPRRHRVRAEFRYRHARGHYLWLETIGKSTLDERGRINGAVFASRDVSERRQAEQALREIHQTLETTIQASPLAIVVVDNQSHVKVWNPAAATMFGWSREELLDRPYPLVPAQRKKEFDDILSRLRQGENLLSFETERRTRNGQLLQVGISSAALRDGDGRILGSVAILSDITERKRAEAALKASEANYRAIFDAANDAIFVLDIDSGAILDVNRKLCEMYGHSRAQLLQLPIEAVSSGKLPYTQENAMTWIHSAVDGASRLFEWHARKKSGELFWVEVNMKGAMINGRYRALAVVRDITGRKRAEAALKESEHRFRQIFEQNEDPAFLLDPRSLAIVDANSAAVQLYGYGKDKLLAGSLEQLMEPDAFSSFTRHLEAGREKDISATDWSTISPINTRDAAGRTIIASFRGKIIRSQGKPCLYGTLRDITEKLRIRKERNELQAKLLQANKMTAIGTLASGIAHEINNPNNYILSNAQFLTDMWQDLKVVLQEYAAEYGDFSLGGLPYREAVEDLPRLIEGMAEGAHRIKNIVTNLKDFARQEETPLHRPFDLNKAIEAALVMLANKIKKHTDHFFRNLAPDLPPVMGHFQKIEQVILNLVINALQALPEKRLGVYLSTTWDAATRQVRLKIRDQGEGIPEDIKTRILDPFFTTRQKTGGTGLGLSICYAIVNEHRGTLDFDSQPGRGTTVTLSLPAVLGTAETHPQDRGHC